MKSRSVSAALFALLCAPLAHGESSRVRLIPRLLPGQSFQYFVSVQRSRDIKTESRVVIPNVPSGERLSVLIGVHVEVLARAGGALRLRATLESPFPASQTIAAPKPSTNVTPPPIVEFSLQDSGAAANISGLDALSLEQQTAWQEWLAQFASPMLYPSRGVKRGDHWESQEPETAPSPIAQLVWLKKYQYVRDEPCPAAQITPRGDLIETTNSRETCAVILTTAALKQKSSVRDATPEDYKLSHLRTKGSATGKNEVILYVSRSTGFLMRASETAVQSMAVTIALDDGSNQVHYDIEAQSRARVFFLQSKAPADP